MVWTQQGSQQASPRSGNTLHATQHGPCRKAQGTTMVSALILPTVRQPRRLLLLLLMLLVLLL